MYRILYQRKCTGWKNISVMSEERQSPVFKASGPVQIYRVFDPDRLIGLISPRHDSTSTMSPSLLIIILQTTGRHITSNLIFCYLYFIYCLLTTYTGGFKSSKIIFCSMYRYKVQFRVHWLFASFSYFWCTLM